MLLIPNVVESSSLCIVLILLIRIDLFFAISSIPLLKYFGGHSNSSLIFVSMLKVSISTSSSEEGVDSKIEFWVRVND
jgi:hypothetical protein